MCTENDKNKDQYWTYHKERHACYVARREKLDDLAFKTSERYDHWILTISGGALAISLTFLEKIAPNPDSKTIFILLVAWLSFVISILCAFWAIGLSRKAIYRQIDIADEKHEHFQKTSNEANPAGETLKEPTNQFALVIDLTNKVASICLVVGSLSLCFFTFVNINTAKSSKNALPMRIDVNVNSFQSGMSTNGLHQTNKNTP